MKPILTIALSALMLAGCADGYDKSAMPDAAISAHRAIDGCKARLAANDIKNHSELEGCELTAARAFFTTLKMKRMDRFEAYAISMQALAADLDANRATDQQARSRGREIVAEFMRSCDCKPRHMMLPWDGMEGSYKYLGGRARPDRTRFP